MVQIRSNNYRSKRYIAPSLATKPTLIYLNETVIFNLSEKHLILQ